MKTRIMTLLIVAISITGPAAVQAQQLFDFNGQTNLPVMVGGSLTMYSEMFDPSPAVTPIPLDFANSGRGAPAFVILAVFVGRVLCY